MSDPAPCATTATRRELLRDGAYFGGALVIAFALRAERATAQSNATPEKSPSSAADASASGLRAPDERPFAPNAWLRIGADDTVTVLVDRSELGQGVSTSLPMLVAEELGADWTKVRFAFAPAAPEYANPILHAQGTGGSTSIRAAWKPLRTAAAAARDMLIDAAAKTWSVDRGECAVQSGRVVHAKSARSASF